MLKASVDETAGLGFDVHELAPGCCYVPPRTEKHATCVTVSPKDRLADHDRLWPTVWGPIVLPREVAFSWCSTVDSQAALSMHTS